MTILGGIIFMAFLFINFKYTQKIYNSNYTIKYLLISFLLSAIVSYSVEIKDYYFVSKFVLCSLISYYLIILVFVKLIYKKINNVLIYHKLIKKKFEEKDFTYVTWDSDVTGSEYYWDDIYSKEPSWLDILFSFLLIILPILMLVLFNAFIANAPSKLQ